MKKLLVLIITLLSFIFSCSIEKNLLQTNNVVSSDNYIIIQIRTSINKALIDIEESQIVEVVFRLHSPNGVIETKNWTPGDDTEIRFLNNGFGIYTIEVTETDIAGISTIICNSFEAQEEYNYIISIQLGGNIIINISSDAEIDFKSMSLPFAQATLYSFIYNNSLFVVFGTCVIDGVYTNSIYKYENSWNHLTDFPSGGLHAPGIIHINDTIYVVGGTKYSDNLANENVYSYSLSTLEWKTLAPIASNRARENFSIAAANNKIYIFGGSYISTKFSYVDCFDPFVGSIGEWTSLTNYPVLNGSKAITLNGNIYIFGGTTTYDAGNGHSSGCLKYLIDSDSFIELSNLPINLAGKSAVLASIDRKIFILGGEQTRWGGSTVSVYAYNIDTNLYEKIRNLSKERYFSSGFSYQDKIILIGGIQRASGIDAEITFLDDIEVYEP